MTICIVSIPPHRACDMKYERRKEQLFRDRMRPRSGQQQTDKEVASKGSASRVASRDVSIDAKPLNEQRIPPIHESYSAALSSAALEVARFVVCKPPVAREQPEHNPLLRWLHSGRRTYVSVRALQLENIAYDSVIESARQQDRPDQSVWIAQLTRIEHCMSCHGLRLNKTRLCGLLSREIS
jgi:hypothetical protein